MSGRAKNVDALGMDQLLAVLKALKRQLNATKRVHFSYRGIVTETVEVPDHKAQLRAIIELIKLHGLYPRRGGRRSADPYDGSEQPVINLVMPGPERDLQVPRAIS